MTELSPTARYVLYDIPRSRIADSSIWFLMLRGLVYPGENGPKDVYETLLPYLNQRPLLDNFDYNYSARPVPTNNDFSRIGVVNEALRHTLIFGGLTPAYAMHLSTLTQVMYGKFLDAQLAGSASLSTSDAMLVHFMAQGIARMASTEGAEEFSPFTTHEHQFIAELVTAVNEKVGALIPSDVSVQHLLTFRGLSLRFLTARVLVLYCECATARHAFRALADDTPLRSQLPPNAQVAADLKASPEHKEQPLFGRLRRDVSVEGLIGTAPLAPIEIPVEFTKMSDTVTNFHEAATAMRDAVELCQLLDCECATARHAFRALADDTPLRSQTRRT